MNSVQLEVDFSPNLTGDRIKLPPSYLDKLLKFNPELPSPLTFRLLANSIISHASVLEFTSSENVIQISDFLADKLSVTQGQVIEISLVHLEKCTFAKLAPLTANYLAIKDIRSLLEAYLRKNHTTLTVNESLLVNIGKEESVTFLITELKPDPQCLCLNTDMEVDIQPLDNNLAEDAVMAKFSKNDNVLQWKSLSSNPTIEASGSLDVEDAAFFKIPTLSAIDYSSIEIQIQPTVGDFEAYLSNTTEKPSIKDHSMFSVDTGALNFNVSADLFNDTPFIYLGLYSTKVKSSFSVSMNAARRNETTDQSNSSIIDENMDGKEQCPNCQTYVPSQTITMHSAFCFRNNVLCTKCNGVFRKQDFSEHWHCDSCDKYGPINWREKHISLYHTPIICDCNESLYLPNVAKHKKNDCVERQIVCRYCHLSMRAGNLSRTGKDLILGLGLTEHESECGARTITCQKCNKSIQLKDIQTHAKIHELQKQTQYLFKLCTNVNCGNPQSDQFSNLMKLCVQCFKPFWSPRHDPGNQKLAQKIVQVYHHQLTVGCGTDYCTNKYCCSSSDGSICTSPMDPNDSAMMSVNLLQKSFLAKPTDPLYHFCVTERAVAQRRVNAGILSLSGFKMEWCIKALMENNENIDASQIWLRKNAPKIVSK